MSEIRNFQGECSKCGQNRNLFALDCDDEGYCQDCLEEAEE